MKLPDLIKPFILRTGASGVGVPTATVLLQENEGKLYPVGYVSEKFSLAEATYLIIEKECLTAVWGIRRFKLYLAGKRFTHQTNHKPLTYLNDAAYQNDRVFPWAMAVQEYSFLVQGTRHPRKGEHWGRFLEMDWIFLLMDRLSDVNIHFYFLLFNVILIMVFCYFVKFSYDPLMMFI